MARETSEDRKPERVRKLFGVANASVERVEQEAEPEPEEDRQAERECRAPHRPRLDLRLRSRPASRASAFDSCSTCAD